ncbi:MAG: FHIPEP family type III secretion protein, partial [Planctomycetales bacterium]|nr:FHIPEP family type III secretion protein [Planctomycetales bacterium]
MISRSETVLSLGLLGVLIVLLVPLPPVLLDMLLAGNLAITILLLLITVNVTQPYDISVFPSLLLLITLYRLSLNVATTRLILLEGDAGKIVSTFGGFVVGGNLVVGLVIFLILIIIQFIVITKGASRVSEVAARFALDAMPGKQIAIDAELNSGLIDEKEARRRRELLSQESEFYGAMDGAGKFVRGDAIAGLVITGINLLGGIVLGV